MTFETFDSTKAPEEKTENPLSEELFSQIVPRHRERDFRVLERTIADAQEWLNSPAAESLRSQQLKDRSNGANYTAEDYKIVVADASNFVLRHDQGLHPKQKLDPYRTVYDGTFYQVNERGLSAYIQTLERGNQSDPQLVKRLDIARTMQDQYAAFASQVPANYNNAERFFDRNSDLRRLVESDSRRVRVGEMKERVKEYIFHITPESVERINDKDTLESGISATKIAIAARHSDHFGRHDSLQLPRASYSHVDEQRGYELTEDIVSQSTQWLAQDGNPFKDLPTYSLDDYKSVFDEIDKTIPRLGTVPALMSRDLGSGVFTHLEAKTFFENESAKLAQMQAADIGYDAQWKKVNIAKVLYFAGPCGIQSQSAEHIAEVWDPSRIGSQGGSDYAVLYTKNDLLSAAFKDENPFDITKEDIALSLHHSDYYGPQDPEKNHALNTVPPGTMFSIWNPNDRHVFIRVGRHVDAAGNVLSEGDPRIPYLPPMHPVKPYLQRGQQQPENNVLDYDSNPLPGTKIGSP